MARRQLLERARIADVVAALGAARLGELVDILEDRLASVTAAIAAADLAVPPNVERDLHQLRGSAASLGLAELAAEIAGLERQVRALPGDGSRSAALAALATDAAGLAGLLAASCTALARMVPGVAPGPREPAHGPAGAGSNR